ncbi:hypothetical protein J3F83DRAFT_284529 [Trichoderma novae-zelandiae]
MYIAEYGNWSKEMLASPMLMTDSCCFLKPLGAMCGRSPSTMEREMLYGLYLYSHSTDKLESAGACNRAPSGSGPMQLQNKDYNHGNDDGSAKAMDQGLVWFDCVSLLAGGVLCKDGTGPLVRSGLLADKLLFFQSVRRPAGPPSISSIHPSIHPSRSAACLALAMWDCSFRSAPPVERRDETQRSSGRGFVNVRGGESQAWRPLQDPADPAETDARRLTCPDPGPHQLRTYRTRTNTRQPGSSVPPALALMFVQ